MKKNLQSRISKYTAVAGAVVSAAGAQAQVVYTDVNPDYSHDAPQNNGFAVYPLDLNNDQTVDFVIASRDTVTPNATVRLTIAAPYGVGNAIAGENPGGYDYALALDMNSMVDSTLNWIAATNTMAYNVNSANPYNENWNGVTDKYLGLKFVVGANTHYGWARLDSYAIGDSIVLKDYAYEATPNVGILTGNMGSSLTETQVENLIKFVNQANNTVQVVVNGNLTNGVVSVVSSTGQVVSTDAITEKTFSVDMNSLSSGIYMVNVTFTEGATTKKIIVH
ncbi:MAG: T9SS type A sorting domain-containing protein [Bacteroidota bacterium]